MQEQVREGGKAKKKEGKKERNKSPKKTCLKSQNSSKESILFKKATGMQGDFSKSAKQHSSKSEERNGTSKLSLLLNTSQAHSFLRKDSSSIETISMEPDSRGKFLQPFSSTPHTIGNFHLKPIVFGQTNSNSFSYKQSTIGNIFQAKSPSTNVSFKGGDPSTQDSHNLHNQTSQDSFHLPNFNRQKPSESLPRLQSSESNVNQAVPLHHGFSKSSLMGSPMKSVLNNNLNPFQKNFSALVNPTFNHSALMNQTPSPFNISSSMVSNTQSQQHISMPSSINKGFLQQPLHRPNSRSFGGSGGLAALKKPQNQEINSVVSSSSDLSKMNSTVHKMLRSQKTTGGELFPSNPNTPQSNQTPKLINQSEPSSSKNIPLAGFYQSSLRHIDILDDHRLASPSDPVKKVISFQTSNALLPQSLINSTKNLKKMASHQIITMNSIYSPSLTEDMPIEQPIKSRGTNRIVSLIQKNDNQADSSFDTPTEKSNAASKRSINIPDNIIKHEFDENYKDEIQLGSLRQIQIPLKTATPEPLKAQNIIQFEQTPEQKKFQSEFLQKIRFKHLTQGKLKNQQITVGSDQNSSQSKFSLINLVNTMKNNSNTDSNENKNSIQSTQHEENHSSTPSDIIEKFTRILEEDVVRQNNPIGKAYAFFLSDVKTSSFCQIVIQLFSNAFPELLDTNSSNQSNQNKNSIHNNVTSILKNGKTISNSKSKSDLTANSKNQQKNTTFKIPEKLFWILVREFKQRVLIGSFNYSPEKLEEFTFKIQSSYELLGIRPANLLEELGGRKRCERLLNEFSAILQQEFNKQRDIPEKSVIDVGMAMLMDDEHSLDQQVESIKLGKIITPKELFKMKFIMYQFLTDRESFLDSETKASFLQKFERIRYNHFSNYSKIDLDSISSDILKYIATKKPIQEYFQEERKQDLVQIFVIQVLECLLFRLKPSAVVAWLNQNTKKQPDDSFFFMIESLFLEPFRQQKVGNAFLKNCELKFFWLRMTANLTFDASSVVSKIDELLSSMRTWIDGMVTQHQLTKQQASNIDQIQNVSFLKCFVQSIFTEDTFSVSDINQLLSIFKTSNDSVLFQLKGLKRIFLIMRFKPNEAYEIAEFLLKTFTDSLNANSPQ